MENRPETYTLLALAERAEALGFDSICVGDSVTARPRHDPLTLLAAVAARTTSAELGTAVLLPALRQPTVLAHQLANIDQISQGRLVLGLGVGWGLPAIVREWEACGKNHRRRVRDLEEHIQVWRKLWSGAPVSMQGSDFKLTEQTIGPQPWTEKGPPILVTAGNRGEIIPAQIDRVGKFGDGIITTYVTESDIRKLRDVCAEAMARHGRLDPNVPNFPLCVYTTVCIENDVAKAEAQTREFLDKYYGGGVNFRGMMGLGPPAVVAEVLQRYAAAGVTDLCVRLVGENQVSQMRKFVSEIVPLISC